MFTTSSIRRRSRAAACRRSSCTTIDGPFASTACRVVPVPSVHGARPILGFRFGALRLSDRLQRDSRRVVAAARRRRRAGPRRAAPSRRIRRTSPWPKPLAAVDAHRRRGRPISRTSATTCRTPRPTRRCRPVSSSPTTGWSSTSRLVPGRWYGAAADVEVIHFPDDPRPPRWASPVLALGNFDGLHRGHRRSSSASTAAPPSAAARRVVLTFDPHPPRVLRPDKAPPLLMTKAQKLEALDARRHPGRGGRPLHARDVAVGAGDVRPHRAGRLAARRRSVGRRRFPVRPRAQRQLHAAALARRAVRLPRREDRSGPLQGLRRLEHAHPPAGQRRPRRRGRRAARPPLRDRRHGRARARNAAASWAFRPPTSRPTNELVPPHGVYATTLDHRRHRACRA